MDELEPRAPEQRPPSPPTPGERYFEPGRQTPRIPAEEIGPYRTRPLHPSKGDQRMATASLVLGIVAAVTWWIPFVGVLVALGGMLTGARSRREGAGRSAVAGLVLSVIAFVAGGIITTLVLIGGLIGLATGPG